MDVKSALRVLWKDLCTITEYREYTRKNKSTGHTETIVLENEPCKLSFETLQIVSQTETAAGLVQRAKLFIGEDVSIPAGCKIVITRENGKAFEFKQSGEAGVFTNHQEIVLVPFEVYA